MPSRTPPLESFSVCYTVSYDDTRSGHLSELSTAQPQHRYTYHLIVPHPEEPRLLLQHTSEGWALPSFEPRLKYLARVEQNNNWARERLGLDCITLYVAQVEEDLKEPGSVDATYVLQVRDRAWSPSGHLRWAGREEIATLELTVAGQRATIEGWLDEREGRIEPPQRGTWNSPGWYEEACGWIQEQLESHGIRVTARPEQFKHWIITSALRVLI